ncbi:MAG: translation initiation factor [Actinomycetota bacterium]|jgi:translation initiation factor IF-3|nr:translation initiation factor [Actinomycetota bacterium]
MGSKPTGYAVRASDRLPVTRVLGVTGFFRPSTESSRQHGEVDRQKESNIATELRINDRIRSPQVRVVGAEGEQIGIIDLDQALTMAQDLDLDLVEVAGQADPPVCRIMDYSKYKYEQDMRQKAARKKQSLIVVKEIKMRPKIDRHDYETKKGHVVRFLKEGAKVKTTIMFRGREMTHTELGRRLLDRLAQDVAEIAKVETYPKLDGRNMTMVLSPYKEAISKKSAPPGRDRGRSDSERPRAERPAAEPTEEDVPAEPKPPKVTRAEGG